MSPVLGVPNSEWGEAVKAVIVPRAGIKLAAAEFIALVKRLQGSAHAPKHVEFVDAVPITSVGKVDKKILKGNSGPDDSGWLASPSVRGLTPKGINCQLFDDSSI